MYTYTSQSEGESNCNSCKHGLVFDYFSCLFRAIALSNVSFSNGKAFWKESNSELVKDYSSTTLYCIFYSEVYGMEIAVNIKADKNNPKYVEIAIVNAKTGTNVVAKTINIGSSDTKF